MNETPEELHKPVLLRQVIEALVPVPNGLYLDGTLGLGGHAEAVLKSTPDCKLCGLDRDEDALTLAKERLAPFGDRVHYFHTDFADFEYALKKLDWKSINGAMLDLGVSSLQLDDALRGFSFRKENRLDMRMNPASGGKSAWEIVNYESFDTLKNYISIYGEEPRAGRIARNIVESRAKTSIDTTSQLADIVWKSYPPEWRRSARNHPATRTFQALRIIVNDELGQLKCFLDSILAWLGHGARLVIISFHSLEDRLVKHVMKGWAKGEIGNRNSDCKQCTPQARILFKKPLTADEEEKIANPRARSAKLRCIEKI